MDDDKSGIFSDEPSESKNPDVALAVLNAKMRMVSFMIRNELVTRHEFAPVKLITYGLVAVVFSSVLVGILSYVIKKG
jgi:hypothetical protein